MKSGSNPTFQLGLLSTLKRYGVWGQVSTYKRKPAEPKIWFTSIKSFASVLSDENQELLRVIHDNNPESIADLEQMTGRKASNLSRTLRTMANYGLVRLEEGAQGRGRRAVKPVAVARSVNLTLDIGLGDAPASGRRHAESVVAQ